VRVRRQWADHPLSKPFPHRGISHEESKIRLRPSPKAPFDDVMPGVHELVPDRPVTTVILVLPEDVDLKLAPAGALKLQRRTASANRI